MKRKSEKRKAGKKTRLHADRRMATLFFLPKMTLLFSLTVLYPAPDGGVGGCAI